MQLQYLNSPAGVSASWQPDWAWCSVVAAPASVHRGPHLHRRSAHPPPAQSVSLSGVRSSPACLSPSVGPSVVWRTPRGRYSEYLQGHLRWRSIFQYRLSLGCRWCCSHPSPRFLPRCSCTPCWPGLWTAQRQKIDWYTSPQTLKNENVWFHIPFFFFHNIDNWLGFPVVDYVLNLLTVQSAGNSGENEGCY